MSDEKKFPERVWLQGIDPDRTWCVDETGFEPECEYVRADLAHRPRTSDGRTHWEGCYTDRGHHECALSRLERTEGLLRAAAEALRRCDDALGALPEDALGRDSRFGHPYRDELHSEIQQILARPEITELLEDDDADTP